MISIDGEKARQDLRRLADAFSDSIALSVQNAVRAGVEHAKSTTAFKDSGRSGGTIQRGWAKSAGLRKNIYGTTYSSRASVWGKLVADTPYAQWVEEGTPPHEIRPRRAKALSFVMNGERVFRGSVNHPGTRPTYFMRQALHEAVGVFESSFELTFNSALRRFE